MKKRIIALVLALVLMMAMTACSKTKTESDVEYIQANGKMIVGITDFAPMNYKDDSGKWIGFDTELAEAVCEKLGVDAEFIEISWDNKELELDAKSIDCVWNGMTLTDGVKAAMETSEAYLTNAQVVVMNADKLADYTTIESLAELNFAAEAGSAGEAALKDNNLNCTSVSSQANALLEVASGSVDACVIDSVMAAAMTGEGTSYSQLGIGIALVNEELYGIGFRKGSDMAKKVDEIIDELEADGTVEALAAKYNLTSGLIVG